MKNIGLMLLSVFAIFMVAACSSEESQGSEGKEEPVEVPAENTDETEDQTGEIDLDQAISHLKLEAEAQPSKEKVLFDFSLTNEAEETYKLGFSSGQKYEIIVTDANGKEVYKYSDGKMFTEALEYVTFNGGDTQEFQEEWTEGVVPGNYEAMITIKVMSINDQPLESEPFTTTVPFEIGEGATQNDSDQSAGEEAFRNLQVSGEDGSYTITGEARVFEGQFRYNVEDGHNILIEDTVVEVDEGAPAWASFSFEITLSEDQLPDNGSLTLTIYQVNPSDGRPTNVNYVPLESFQ
ncbi:BsuPI-related putative proteinase inhibitor [Thalassobacillus hwangdonensis]|uniref:Immunoglobulin-like domain of spore germination n=1 Tax=Thalassobacillus hwangdonensis TaxID=546108 RepID=A0ABW3KXL4_9BACI